MPRRGASKPKCSKCVPTDAELQRLSLGYSRLTYLLDNWEKETTVCIRGCVGDRANCGCVQDPIVVQGYMGFKSMNDPLFKIDQVMLRAQSLVSDADFDRYSAAIDRWVEKADEVYVSPHISPICHTSHSSQTSPTPVFGSFSVSPILFP